MIKFTDLYKDFNGNSYYIVPNEEPLVLRDMIKYLRIDRAAGICSGGEVGLFSMLPSVRKELVLVDHCYQSLAMAMMKYLIFHELGAVEGKKLLTSYDTSTDLPNLNKKLLDSLPKNVKKSLEIKYAPTICYSYLDSSKINTSIAGMWATFPDRVVAKLCQKLDLVSFIHGDMTDLAKHYEPFDLFYISNAMGHTDRDRKAPRIEEIKKVVRPGGYILSASPISSLGSRIRANKGRQYSQWDYSLYKV